MVTDEQGAFRLTRHDSGDHGLVFSFVGFANDTIRVLPVQNEVNMVLTRGEKLEEVTVPKRLGGAYISKLRPFG